MKIPGSHASSRWNAGTFDLPVECPFFQVRQALGRPSQTVDLVLAGPIRIGIDALRKSLRNVVGVEQGQSDLFQMILALNSPCGLPRRLYGGQ